MDAHLLKRLGLTAQKLNNVTAGIRAIAASDEPIGQVALCCAFPVLMVAPSLYSWKTFLPLNRVIARALKATMGGQAAGRAPDFPLNIKLCESQRHERY